MTTIYESILARLTAQVPELKEIDLQKGQMNYPRPPLAFPAALLTIQLTNCENLNSKKQRCDVIITVDLCFDFTGNTTVSTPEVERLKSLAYFALVEKTYANLQGWGTSAFNPLARTNLIDTPRPDAYKVVKTVFKSAFHDYAAAELVP